MSEQPKPSAASIVMRDKRNRQHRRRRWLIAGGSVVVLALFVTFGLPPIIRSVAEKKLAERLHREVAIGKIRLNPLTLAVTVENLAIKDRDGGPFTGWRRLYVNFDSFSLFTGEWRFDEIDLDGFGQHVAIAKDGTFNFADLIPPPAPAAGPAAPAAEKSEPRPLRIRKLAVKDSALHFADASRAQPFATHVGPLSFTLENFVTAGDPKAPYSFTATTESGESFSWTGTVSVDPVRSAGEFTLGKLALKKYAPYYHHFISADLLDGVLDVTGRYVVDLSRESNELTLSNAAVKVSRLQVAARGTTTPLIDLPSFTIDGLSADGLKTAASIRRIELAGGRLSVVRERDGSINLLNLLKPSAGAVSATSAQATVPPAVALPSTTAGASLTAAGAKLPDVKLTEFAITGLAIDVEDLTTPTPAKNAIGRLEVSLKNFSLAEPAAPVLVSVAVDTLPSGRITVDGSAVREPLAADLAVKVDALPLAGGTPYVEPLLNVRIAGGAVSVEGKARLNGTVASFVGHVVVDKLATVDGGKGEEFAGFTQLAIRGIDAVSAPLTARIGEIVLVDPSARVIVNADKSTNLATILRQGAAPAVDPEQAPSVSLPPTSAPAPTAGAAAFAGPVWSLGKFTLRNGSFTLLDRSVKPAARISLDQFSGTVANLSSADLSRGDVDFRGKMNGSGSIAITGKLDAKATTAAPGARTEIVVDVKDVDLSPISPYVGTFAGYELQRAGLAVDVKASLAQRKLDTDNVVTLRQFTLGEPTNSPEATKLPVRLGIALLKDMDGNIVIDLPVEGDLDDPNFRIGRVVIRVITNLLVKAASSPFSLIGAAFGGGGDELAYQTFEAGAVSPQETELKKLETLRKALKNRPGLNLDITGSYDGEADLPALRDQILSKQVRFRLWEELRAKNPETPPPAELTVSPEDEARIVGVFMAERYPGGLPVAGADGNLPPPTPVYAPMPGSEPAPQKRPAAPVIRRNQRIYSSWPHLAAKSKPEEPAKPAPVVIAPSAGAAAAAGGEGAPPALTLADARRALASGIPVSEDDLRQLATDRAQKVRDALLAGGEIAAERVFTTPPADEPKGARVFLQLR